MKKSIKYLALFFLLVTVSGCTKTAMLTVSVNMQTPGQPVQIGANIGVRLVNETDSNDWDGELTSALGVAVFDKVKNGTYKVSAERWDGSKALVDEKNYSN